MKSTITHTLHQARTGGGLFDSPNINLEWQEPSIIIISRRRDRGDNWVIINAVLIEAPDLPPGVGAANTQDSRWLKLKTARALGYEVYGTFNGQPPRTFREILSPIRGKLRVGFDATDKWIVLWEDLALLAKATIQTVWPRKCSQFWNKVVESVLLSNVHQLPIHSNTFVCGCFAPSGNINKLD